MRSRARGERVSTPTWDEFDNLSNLPPTGRRILRAAHRLLRRKGFAALTLQAIARESGEHKASVGYYFGSKAGLIAVLADLVGHDIVSSARVKLRSLPPGGERVREAVRANRRVSENSEEFRILIEILAHALRTRELRERLARLYGDYRRINVGMIADDRLASTAPVQLEALATLSLAITDGMSVQSSLDSDFDGAPAWELWESILEERIGRLQPG